MEEKYDLIENIISKISGITDINKINTIINIIHVSFWIILLFLGFVIIFYPNPKFLIFYISGYIFFGFIMFFLIMLKSLGCFSKILIIFLYSHGLIGLYCMLYPSIYTIFSNPLMSDNPINIYIYLFIFFLCIIVAFILNNLIILFDKFREIKHIDFYIMFLYTIGFIFIFILPLIFNYVYYFKLF